jgi:hypothetical protein
MYEEDDSKPLSSPAICGRILDRVINEGGETVIERNSSCDSDLGGGQQNALEAMADLYRTLREYTTAGCKTIVVGTAQRRHRWVRAAESAGFLTDTCTVCDKLR